MAIFGLPGGAEWLLILGVIIVMFVPSLLFFGLGYFTGKNAGVRSAIETVGTIVPEVAEDAPASLPLGDEAASPGDPDA